MSVFAMLCAVLGILSAVLVFHAQYEDGLFGRLALGGVVLSSVIVVVSEIDAKAPIYAVSPEVMVLMASMVAFYIRHVYRFLKWAHYGQFDWKRSKQ